MRLELFEDPSLPNPRARFLMIDTADKLAAALVTKGLPLGQGRTLALDGVTVLVGATIAALVLGFAGDWLLLPEKNKATFFLWRTQPSTAASTSPSYAARAAPFLVSKAAAMSGAVAIASAPVLPYSVAAVVMPAFASPLSSATSLRISR